MSSVILLLKKAFSIHLRIVSLEALLYGFLKVIMSPLLLKFVLLFRPFKYSALKVKWHAAFCYYMPSIQIYQLVCLYTSAIVPY